MTAVATPISLAGHSSGWSDINGYKSTMNGSTPQTDSGIMSPGSANRKVPPRANSSASLLSNASADSDSSDAASLRTIGPPSENPEDWATRKKPTRGIWPAGKSEPTAVLSTARSQSSISSAASGPSAASAISALHTPVPSPQQMANPHSQLSNGIRNGVHPAEPTVVLFLLPINHTFERKTISVPITPNVVRVGRQTNIKTAPTPTNAFFDSKVLSRQHAEVFADRQGRVFIKDVKSSNGTFVNGKRLSPENQESEPHELHEQDVVELGIDIVSEDQKVVVHHKVAARVEHAGIYTHNRDHPFAEHDAAAALTNRKGYNQQMKRGGPPGPGTLKTGMNSANAAAALAARDELNQQHQAQQQQQQQQMLSRMFLQPVSTELIVRRLNHELRLARQQSQDIAKIRHSLDEKPPVNIFAEADKPAVESPKLQQAYKAPETNGINHAPINPTELAINTMPNGHLQPESPRSPRGQPALARSYTVKPAEILSPATAVPQEAEALTTLSRELDAANARIPSLEDKIKLLERELLAERDARTKAEAQIQKPAAEALPKQPTEIAGSAAHAEDNVARDLQDQLDRMNVVVNDMKTTIESYRQRAETAERERDETKKTLEQMIEEKRAIKLRNPDRAGHIPVLTSIGSKLQTKTSASSDRENKTKTFLLPDMLSEAGIGQDQKLSPQQAAALQSILHRNLVRNDDGSWLQLSHHGVPHMCAVTTIVLGLTLMHYLNGWEKVQR